MSNPKHTSSSLDDELKKLFPANDISRWRLLEWIKAYSRYLTIGLFSLSIVFIALLNQSEKTDLATSKIEALKESWVDPKNDRTKLLEELQTQLSLRPEGFSGWKGSLMQSAIMLNQSTWVEKWRTWPCEKEVYEIPELASLWKSSSKAALLTSQSHLSQALLLVETTLNQAPAANSEAEKMILSQLYLQKAMLYQSLENPDKELKSWKELLALLDVDLSPSLSGVQLKKPLSGWQDTWVHSWGEEKTTLLDYIAYRLKALEK